MVEMTDSGAPPLVLITGPMAAGKSSVAAALAQRFERSVHLRGDRFRRMIERGRVDMGAEDADEALAQLRLRYRLAAQAALEYRRENFTVIYQDVVLGDLLPEVVALFEPVVPAVFVLCPRADVIRRREAGREKSGYGAVSVEQLQQALDATPRIGDWIDSSVMSVAQTVDEIYRRLTNQEPVAQ